MFSINHSFPRTWQSYDPRTSLPYKIEKYQPNGLIISADTKKIDLENYFKLNDQNKSIRNMDLNYLIKKKTIEEDENDVSIDEPTMSDMASELYVEQLAIYYYLRRISFSKYKNTITNDITVMNDNNDEVAESINPNPKMTDDFLMRVRRSPGFAALWKYHTGILEGIAIESNHNNSTSSMKVWGSSWCENKLWLALLYLLMWEQVSYKLRYVITNDYFISNWHLSHLAY